MGSSTSALLLLLLAASAVPPQLVLPNFSDLTIKTRQIMGDRHSSVQTLYLKGARQRIEHLTEKPAIGSDLTLISITQCDRKLILSVNETAKTYTSFPIEDWSERLRRARANPRLPRPEMTGADVIVTIDSVDAGGRRQMGSYTARHMKVATKVEPGPGAVTRPSIEERDGWYVDLPGLYCRDSTSVQSGWLAAWSGRQDRVILKRLGVANLGYPIEETARKTEGSWTGISTIELLEFSEAPLDASLFELPAGYSPALHTPRGGYDMKRPDTLGNRLQAYWAELEASVRHWFR
jgi:hypothetical protein